MADMTSGCKTYADLLYLAAEELQAEANALGKSKRAQDHSAVAQGAVQRLYELAETLLTGLRSTPYADVLSTEQLHSITKKYDRSGTHFADIHELADSHEAMRRALEEQLVRAWRQDRAPDA